MRSRVDGRRVTRSSQGLTERMIFRTAHLGLEGTDEADGPIPDFRRTREMCARQRNLSSKRKLALNKLIIRARRVARIHNEHPVCGLRSRRGRPREPRATRQRKGPMLRRHNGSKQNFLAAEMLRYFGETCPRARGALAGCHRPSTAARSTRASRALANVRSGHQRDQCGA